MIKYLTTQGVNYYLENLLKNATTRIVLISPYIQLQKRIQTLLKEKKEGAVHIDMVCRKKDLKEDLTNYATNILDVPTLHAKCYMNESEVIITRLNIYEFSQQNNEEMGIYIKNEDAGVELYREIASDVSRLCKIDNSSTIKSTSKIKLNKGKRYSRKQLDDIFNFDYKGNAGIHKTQSGDIVLFNNSEKKEYQDTEEDGTIYYRGQNTGGREQKLIYGNKDLYDAYENKDINIHLFKDYYYSGKWCIVKEPYLDSESGQFIFPLAPE